MTYIETMSTGEMCDFLLEHGASENDVALLRQAQVTGVELVTYEYDDLKALHIQWSSSILDIVAEHNTTPVSISEPMCLVHGKPFSCVICITCDTRICDKCIVTTHESHNFQSYTRVAADLLASVNDIAVKLDAAPAIDRFRKNMRALKDCRADAEERITEWHAAMSALCDERRDAMMQSVERELSGLVEVVGTRLQTATDWAQKADDLVRASKKIATDPFAPIHERRTTVSALSELVASVPAQTEPDVTITLSTENADNAKHMLEGVELCNERGFGKSRLAVARSLIGEPDRTAFIEIYDDAYGQWRQLPQTHIVRSTPLMLVAETFLYVIGGAMQDHECDTTEWISLDETINEEPCWRIVNSSVGMFKNSAAVYMPDRTSILVTGSSSDLTSGSWCESLNIQNNQWSIIPRMLTGRYSHAAAILPKSDNSVVVIGGTDWTGNPLRSCEIYNYNADAWQEWDQLPCHMADCSVAVVKDSIYVMANITTEVGTFVAIYNGILWMSLPLESVWQQQQQSAYLLQWKASSLVCVSVNDKEPTFTAQVDATEPGRRLPAHCIRRKTLAAISYE